MRLEQPSEIFHESWVSLFGRESGRVEMGRKWIRVENRTNEWEKNCFEGGAYKIMKYAWHSVIWVLTTD